MSLKCLIIGLGQIGMGYDLALDPKKFIFTHARAFSMHSKFDLIGGVDSDKNKRDFFVKNYLKPAYENISLALKAHKPNIIVISIPTSSHLSVIKEVLLFSKPDLILCEKPLSYIPEEGMEIVRICNDANVKIYVNYMRRADIATLEIKKRIQDGRFSGSIKGFVWYSKGFLNNGSHFFNLLEFWLGPFIKGNLLNDISDLNIDNLEFDYEVDALVEFEKGKVIFMSCWEEAFSQNSIELISPSGRLKYEQGGRSVTWQSVEADSNYKNYRVLNKIGENISNNMDCYQMSVANQISDLFDHSICSLPSGKEALITIDSMVKIIKGVK